MVPYGLFLTLVYPFQILFRVGPVDPRHHFFIIDLMRASWSLLKFGISVSIFGFSDRSI